MEKAKMIINTLSKRVGFDDWWDNIDFEIRKEIVEEIDGILG